MMNVLVTLLGVLSILSTLSTTAYAQEDSSIACIKSVCSAQNPLLHPFDKNPQLRESFVKAVEAQTQRPLTLYMGQVIRKALTTDKALETLFQKKDSFTINPYSMGMILTLRAVSRMGIYKDALEFTKEGLIFNKEKLRTLLPQASSEEIEAIASLNDFLSFSITLQRLSTTPLDVLLPSLHPNMDFSAALKAEAQNMVKLQSFVSFYLPKVQFIIPESFVRTKALNGESLSETERKIFTKEVVSRLFWSYLINPSLHDKFKKIPLSTTQLVEEAQRINAQSRVKRSLKNTVGMREFFSAGLKICTWQLTYAYAALPTQQQLASFQTSVVELKKETQGLLQERTGLSLPQVMNIQVLYPTARENALQDWSSSFEAATKQSSSSTNTIEKFDYNDAGTLTSLLAYALGTSDNGLFDEVIDFCTQAQPPFLSDFAQPGKSILTISWPTVVYPEIGIGIAIHEIGHIISGQMASLFQGEKDCLQKKSGSSQYIEEDFADLFAGTLLKRKNHRINNIAVQNFACGIQSRSESGALASSEIKNKNTSDTHSSGFYRLLAIQAVGSESTLQCRQHLTSIKETRFDNYCAWGR